MIVCTKKKPIFAQKYLFMKLNLYWRKKGKSVDDYLINKANLVKLIAFTAVFALCFINIYRPFNSENWYHVSPIKYFLFSFLLVLTGILVIAFSRFLMYRFVHRYSLYYIEYALWIIAEIVVLSGFYTLYTIAVNDHLSWWSWEDVLEVFKNANINTVLVIVLPYAVSWLYFSYDDKKTRLRMMEQGLLPLPKGPTVAQFKDEKGELRFSVAFEHIIFLEAADNYVVIKYVNQGKLSEFLLRNTLKRMAEEFQNTSLRRCHRSYMVNFEHVVALRRHNDEINLELDVPGLKQISVSKSYGNETTEAFLLYSGHK
jgi:hypothetical protein